MVFSATAFIAMSRGTSSKAVVKRAGRSITLDAPISSVKANSIQVLTTPRASATPTAKDTVAASAWLSCRSRLRWKRSAATPEIGASSTSGIARTPSTAPSSAPEPDIS